MKRTLLIWLVALSITTACQPKEGKITSSLFEPKALDISFETVFDTVKDSDGTVLITYEITFPSIYNPNRIEGIDRINEYYKAERDSFIAYVANKGAELANEDRAIAREGGREFYPHSYDRSAEISINNGAILSIKSMQYENTGGIHPSQWLFSETFDVKSGKKLTLGDIFGTSEEEAINKVFDRVISTIEKKPDYEHLYYPDYKGNVRKYYLSDDFFISDRGITFYYQPYAIAPYAAGIQFFELTWSEAGILKIKP